jgi:hypothetical protein
VRALHRQLITSKLLTAYYVGTKMPYSAAQHLFAILTGRTLFGNSTYKIDSSDEIFWITNNTAAKKIVTLSNGMSLPNSNLNPTGNASALWGIQLDSRFSNFLPNARWDEMFVNVPGKPLAPIAMNFRGYSNILNSDQSLNIADRNHFLCRYAMHIWLNLLKSNPPSTPVLTVGGATVNFPLLAGKFLMPYLQLEKKQLCFYRLLELAQDNVPGFSTALINPFPLASNRPLSDYPLH